MKKLKSLSNKLKLAAAFIVSVFIFYPQEPSTGQSFKVFHDAEKVNPPQPPVFDKEKAFTDSLKAVAAKKSEAEDKKQQLIKAQSQQILAHQKKFAKKEADKKQVIVIINKKQEMQTKKQAAATIKLAKAYNADIDSMTLITISSTPPVEVPVKKKRNFFQRLFNIKQKK